MNAFFHKPVNNMCAENFQRYHSYRKTLCNENCNVFTTCSINRKQISIGYEKNVFGYDRLRTPCNSLAIARAQCSFSVGPKRIARIGIDWDIESVCVCLLE